MATVTSIIHDDAHVLAQAMHDRLTVLSASTVLVTGAAGFLCSYVLDVLAAFNRNADRPCHVLALDSFATGLPDRIAHLEHDPTVRFIRHDVSQPFETNDHVDWLLHGASIASPTFYRRHPLETIDVNVGGTRHMLELARAHDVAGLLQLSSSEIYGDPDPAAVPTNEGYVGQVSCTGPRACYDESKRLGETLCTVFQDLHGVPVKIVRPFNVYGPGQRLDDRRIIPDLMRAALQQEPIVLHSDGRATRSFCYVRDFVHGALHVWLTGVAGEAYNVGNDEEVSIARTAALVAELAGPPPLAVRHEMSTDPDYLTDNPQRRCPDLAKVRALGWEPEVSLADGLARTLASYRADGST